MPEPLTQMKKGLTWKSLATGLLYVAAFGAFLATGFTLFKWLQNPADQHWELLNVLLDYTYSIILTIISLIAWIGRRNAPDTPIRFEESSIQLDEATLQRNRQQLIQNVRHSWIEGVLHRSLHRQATIELGLTEKPGAIQREHPLELVLRQSGQKEAPIPADKSMRQIFEDNASGKTFTLLQLAEQLLDEAEQDPTRPVPIVLNIASWDENSKSLVDWLLRQLNRQYGMPKKLSAQWLNAQRFCLLLDGLDEVAEKERDNCLEAINQFKDEYSIDLVVCSRITDYDRLKSRLNLNTAVCLKPLEEDHIFTYLEQFGPSLHGLREHLKISEDWLALAKSPLMLNIMAMTFQEIKLDGFQEKYRSRIPKILFKKFVLKSICHLRISPDTLNKICLNPIGILINLANGMTKHNQFEFYIELIQPTWLRYKLIFQFLTGLVSAFLIVVLGKTVFPLFGISNLGIGYGIGIGLFVVTITKVYLLEGYRFNLPNRASAILALKKGVFHAFCFGSIFGSMNFFILTQENRNVDLSFNELIAFSYILPALVFGTVAGMIQARVAQKDFNKRVTPTQGLRECRVIALLLGLAGGLGGILFGFIVTFPLSPALAEVRLIVFTVSILLGVTAGLSWGGIGLLQHYVLRFLLFKSQVFPFPFSNKKLIESLDFFVQCSLLQRVGGGWRFIHRDLQEYLASIAPDNPKDAAAVWDQEIAGMELPAAVLSLERKRQSGSAKTVVELDLVGYSSICALLEEAGDVNGVATLNSKIQEFVDAGLKSVEAKRSDSVIKTTGDGAILLLDSPQYAHR
ncbi:MAG TPA: NACHT domain-containing protein, partial [Verrucomicrobiales bacterium]|nr:NACHT domain-containing protein [Verrucomicrobiales bacterium]